MDRRRGPLMTFSFLAADQAATALAWLAGYTLRFALLPAPDGVPDVRRLWAALPTVLALAVLAYHVAGMYRVYRLRRAWRELETILRGSGLLFLLVVLVIFFRRDAYESRLALAGFLVLNVALLAVVRRGLWRLWSGALRRRLPAVRAVVLGSGRTARRLVEVVRREGWTGLELLGYADRAGSRAPGGLARLGCFDELPRIVAEHRVHSVLVALPLSRYAELAPLWRTLAELLVEVHFVPDVTNLAGVRARMVELDQVGLLCLRENPHVGLGRLCKRALDIVLAGAALVLAAPLMAALALLVKLTSPGPVLYRQQRIGLGGKPFSILKFRSMRVDAEQATGPVWAKRRDVRCTPLGAFMRRWSLDELPQLFNVLRGEMSLVGPRPERCVFIERFCRQLPQYAQRHQVKAGITGWAQVNGWRGDTSWRRRLECDLYYIGHWSLGLDLKILAMTLWCGFRHRNAH